MHTGAAMPRVLSKVMLNDKSSPFGAVVLCSSFFTHFYMLLYATEAGMGIALNGYNAGHDTMLQIMMRAPFAKSLRIGNSNSGFRPATA